MLKQLTFDGLKKRVGELVSDGESHQMFGRRDGIVSYFEKLIAEKRRENVVIP